MKKRYWLRGGIIGLLIPILIIIIMVIKDFVVLGYLNISLGTPMWEQNILHFVQVVFGLHSLTYGSMFGAQTTELGTDIINIMWGIILVAPIILGAFLGWLYGKFKNKNEA